MSTTRPLLHGILRGAPREPLPAGLRYIDADGLGAVVADVPPEQVPAPDHGCLQEYADRIADLHRAETLIPMRYGCLLETDAAVRRLLQGHRERLLPTLARIDGCAEIGVRLLLPALFPPPAGATAPAGGDARPGHQHLAAIRRRLSGEARAAEQARAARDRLETTVAGLFREVREEFGYVGGRYLLSLYFLVPRANCPDFFERMRRPRTDGLEADLGAGLVTGPWPPYSFVGAIDDDLRVEA